MALKNRDQSKQYVRVKDGKFYLGKDLETPYEELEGTVTSMYYKDEEYEGSPLRKLIIIISDGEDNYQLSINVETSNYSSLISFLKNVDINRKITLHPKMDVKKDGDKETPRRSILVSQDGKFAKSYFTKDDSHGLPKWEVVTVGKKKVTDKSAYLEFLEKFVNENFINKLNRKEVIVNEEQLEEADSKLPWD